MPFISFRIITVDIVVFVKNNLPITIIIMFFKKQCDIDESNFESEVILSMKSFSSKKANNHITNKVQLLAFIHFVIVLLLALL